MSVAIQSCGVDKIEHILSVGIEQKVPDFPSAYTAKAILRAIRRFENLWHCVFSKVAVRPTQWPFLLLLTKLQAL